MKMLWVPQFYFCQSITFPFIQTGVANAEIKTITVQIVPDSTQPSEPTMIKEPSVLETIINELNGG